MGLGEEKALLGEEIVHDQVKNVLFYSLLLYQISIMCKTMARETIKAGMIVRNVQSSDRRPSILYNLDHQQVKYRIEQQVLHNVLFHLMSMARKQQLVYFILLLCQNL